MTTSGSPVNLASSITYMPFGGIASLTYGNSLSLSQVYDSQYRISSITAGSALSLSYGYDANGNATSITESAGNVPGQLLGSSAYTYQSGTNRLTSVTGTPTATLTYDSNGNIISENDRTFTYDLSNRLITVLDNSTEIASYVYDARNLRVKKTTPAETRIFHYDVNGRLIAETNATGTTLVEYVYLNGIPLAMVQPTDTVYYYHTDHIDTPRVMTNASGTIAWKASYNAFGYAEVDGSSTITNNLRFPGQYYDAETNLHYNWNRYYDPRTGRYLTPDPIGLEGGINVFAYVAGNPVNLKDPMGLKSSADTALEQAIAAGNYEYAKVLADAMGLSTLATLAAIQAAKENADSKKIIETTGVPYEPERLSPCPQGDPDDIIRLCIGGCRSVYSNNFFRRQICIIGCILSAF